MFGNKTFINKKILIYGLGISGKSCLKFLSHKNEITIFDDNNKLKNLEKFISFNGPRHYNLYPNKQKIRLHKSNDSLKFKSSLNVNNENFKIFKPPFEIFWKQEN